MKNFEVNDKALENVTGGVNTPLGEYPAEDLIQMYLDDPAGAKGYLNLVKMFYPQLIPEFKKECEEKDLTIPEGMLD